MYVCMYKIFIVPQFILLCFCYKQICLYLSLYIHSLILIIYIVFIITYIFFVLFSSLIFVTQVKGSALLRVRAGENREQWDHMVDQWLSANLVIMHYALAQWPLH